MIGMQPVKSPSVMCEERVTAECVKRVASVTGRKSRRPQRYGETGDVAKRVPMRETKPVMLR